MNLSTRQQIQVTSVAIASRLLVLLFACSPVSSTSTIKNIQNDLMETGFNVLAHSIPQKASLAETCYRLHLLSFTPFTDTVIYYIIGAFRHIIAICIQYILQWTSEDKSSNIKCLFSLGEVFWCHYAIL